MLAQHQVQRTIPHCRPSTVLAAAIQHPGSSRVPARRASAGQRLPRVLGPTWHWCSQESCRQQDIVTSLQVFFAAFQALLYVLCYHLEGLMQPQPPPPAPEQQQTQPQDPRQPEGGGLPAAVRALFQSVMPQLLAHRLSPLAACNVTVSTLRSC
jgi:RNA polymerase I specific transcription initiation factor RRN3